MMKDRKAILKEIRHKISILPREIRLKCCLNLYDMKKKYSAVDKDTLMLCIVNLEFKKRFFKVNFV